MTDQNENGLVPVENINPIEVFSTDKGLDPIIERIREQVKSEDYDISTEEGRKRIGSVARKIGSAKKTLERMALELTEDWRNKTATVNKEKSRMIAEMDALRDEVKQPLDEYNAREQSRIDGHEEAIQELKDLREYFNAYPSYSERAVEHIEELQRQNENIYQARNWQEFVDRATVQYKKNVELLENQIKEQRQYEDEQAELQRLRAAEEERKQREHEEKLKREAAEKARIEAEENAARIAAEEKARVEREKAEAEAKAQAERDAQEAEKKRLADEAAAAEKRAQDAENAKKAAEEKAKKDIEEAKRKAAEEAEAEKQREIAERERREADKKHKAKINNEAADDILLVMMNDAPEHITEKFSKEIVKAIAQGKIRNVKISY